MSDNTNMNSRATKPYYLTEMDTLFRLSHELQYRYESDYDDEFATDDGDDIDDYDNNIRDESVCKKVFDIQNNKELINHCCYNELIHKNSSCPIYMVEFKNGDEVLELPCGHCFIPEAIYEWLENKSSCCPFCRYELPSKELRIETVPNSPSNHNFNEVDAIIMQNNDDN